MHIRKNISIVEQYKDFLKRHPEILEKLSDEQRDVIEKSEDIGEIITIVEGSFPIKNML